MKGEAEDGKCVIHQTVEIAYTLSEMECVFAELVFMKCDKK